MKQVMKKLLMSVRKYSRFCFIGAIKLLDLGTMVILAKFPGRFGGTIMLQNMECVKIILRIFSDPVNVFVHFQV